MADGYRTALDPPGGELSLIDDAIIDAAVAYSRSSPRGRVIQPFHPSDADPLHRMLNAIQPDSYVRPHRHLDPPKAEAWVMLRGVLAFFTFDDAGAITRCVRLGQPGDPLGVDLQPGVYHGLLALVPDTVIYEIKTGPYAPSNDKAFAPWAPVEGTPEAARYHRSLLEAYRARYSG